MALQVNNYQLPQGVVLPAAYLKITEAAIRMDDQPPDANGVIVAAPRLAGSPPFPDTPSVTLANAPDLAGVSAAQLSTAAPVNSAPSPPGAAVTADQLYGALSQGLGVPNTMV